MNNKVHIPSIDIPPIDQINSSIIHKEIKQMKKKLYKIQETQPSKSTFPKNTRNKKYNQKIY